MTKMKMKKRKRKTMTMAMNKMVVVMTGKKMRRDFVFFFLFNALNCVMGFVFDVFCF